MRELTLLFNFAQNSGDSWVDLEALWLEITEFLRSLLIAVELEMVLDVLKKVNREPKESWLKLVGRCHMSFRSKAPTDPINERKSIMITLYKLLGQ